MTYFQVTYILVCITFRLIFLFCFVCQVFEGYGQTETTAAATLQMIGDHTYGQTIKPKKCKRVWIWMGNAWPCAPCASFSYWIGFRNFTFASLLKLVATSPRKPPGGMFGRRGTGETPVHHYLGTKNRRLSQFSKTSFWLCYRYFDFYYPSYLL